MAGKASSTSVIRLQAITPSTGYHARCVRFSVGFAGAHVYYVITCILRPLGVILGETVKCSRVSLDLLCSILLHRCHMSSSLYSYNHVLITIYFHTFCNYNLCSSYLGFNKSEMKLYILYHRSRIFRNCPWSRKALLQVPEVD